MIFGRNNFKTKESGWHFTPPTVLFVPIFKKKEVKMMKYRIITLIGLAGSTLSVCWGGWDKFLKIKTDGIFGTETENALRVFQKNTGQSSDGICGKNSWIAISTHMKENTFAE